MLMWLILFVWSIAIALLGYFVHAKSEYSERLQMGQIVTNLASYFSGQNVSSLASNSSSQKVGSLASDSPGPDWYRGTLTTNFTLTKNNRARSNTVKIGDAEWYFTVSASPLVIHPSYYYPNISVYCKRNYSEVSYDSILVARVGDALHCACSPEKKHVFAGETLEEACTFEKLQSDIYSSSSVFDSIVTVCVDISVKEEESIAAKKVYKIGDKGANIFSPEFLSDCVLILEGGRVIVNKKFLSSHSGFFDKMFSSEFKEKNQKEIELKGIDHAEFVELLLVLYEPLQSIIVENVECVLKLADYFDMKDVVKKCNDFLLLDRKISMERKVLMAQQYNLDDLLKCCMKKYTSFADLKKLMNDHDSLEPKTHKFISERFMELDH